MRIFFFHLCNIKLYYTCVFSAGHISNLVAQLRVKMCSEQRTFNKLKLRQGERSLNTYQGA